MPTSTDRTLSLRIIIEKPFPGILYRLQKGSGNTYETVQKQLSDGSDLVFELAVPVKTNKDGHCGFSGPFVQGTPKERFLYIDMGSYAGQENTEHNGRLKISLPELTETPTGEGEKGSMFTARIPGTNSKNGRPMMATVKPVHGWQVETT